MKIIFGNVLPCVPCVAWLSHDLPLSVSFVSSVYWGWGSFLSFHYPVTRRVATRPCVMWAGTSQGERQRNSRGLLWIMELVLDYIFILFIKAVLKTLYHRNSDVFFTSQFKDFPSFYAVEFQKRNCSLNCHQPLLAMSFWQWPFCSGLVQSLVSWGSRTCRSSS